MKLWLAGLDISMKKESKLDKSYPISVPILQLSLQKIKGT